ncbi:single-pass membrane and coiled-coil domain-containing protein 3 isoform 2-T9 [Ara ararauna]
MLLETTRGTHGKEDEVTVPYTFQLTAGALKQNQLEEEEKCIKEFILLTELQAGDGLKGNSMRNDCMITDYSEEWH